MEMTIQVCLNQTLFPVPAPVLSGNPVSVCVAERIRGGGLPRWFRLLGELRLPGPWSGVFRALLVEATLHRAEVATAGFWIASRGRQEWDGYVQMGIQAREWGVLDDLSKAEHMPFGDG